MTVPVPLKMALLALGLTGFYALVGQFVPQKIVMPPEETVIADDVTTDEMVAIGKTLFDGKGLCAAVPRPGRNR
jgi:hypothetical protein